MSKKLAYYSHSKRIYSMSREHKEVKQLKASYEVLDPNKDIGERGDIRVYLKAIDSCDLVVCSEYRKHIGRGVFEEVRYALIHNKEVLCLRRYAKIFFELVPVKEVVVVDPEDWEVFYGKVIVS